MQFYGEYFAKCTLIYNVIQHLIHNL